MLKESITKENDNRSMKDTRCSKNAPATTPASGPAEVAARLNTARKVGEFCSCDHPRCLAACRSASDRCSDMLAAGGQLIFSAGRGAIGNIGRWVAVEEPYVDDYLSALNRAGIDETRLSSEVTPEGLVRFTRLVCAAGDSTGDREKIREMLDGPVADGIRVNLAPAAEPAAEEGDTVPPDRNTWVLDVRRRLGLGPARDEPGAEATGEKPAIVLADIYPVELARFINSLDIETDIGRISARFVVPYLEQTFDGGVSRDSLVPRSTTARFIRLLRALSPGNQRRFITAAMETSHSFTLFAAAVLEAVPIHLLADVFSEIRPEEHTVHPRIVERFHHLRRLTGHTDRNDGHGAANAEGPSLDSGEGSLLVTSVLDEMPVAQAAPPAAGKTVPGPPAGPGAEFSATAKRRAILKVLLDLFERSTGRQEAESYADAISPLFTQALDEGDWSGLARDWADLAEVTARHRETKPHLAAALERTRASFLTIQALEKFTGCITAGNEEARGHATRLLPALGDRAAESLVLALIASRERRQRRRLLDAVVSLGARAVPLAVRRITDHRWYVVRNMIAIVKEAGDRQAAERLLTLSRHPQFQVRKELIGALLAMEHPAGLKMVERAFREGDAKMRSACIGLLGANRSAGAVDLLLGVLDERNGDSKPFSPAQQASAVWALGQIGDPAALPVLHRRLRRRRVFSAAEGRDLKMAILRSLGGYPPEEAAPLARWGADNGDDDEAAACRRLLNGIRRRDKGTER